MNLFRYYLVPTVLLLFTIVILYSCGECNSEKVVISNTEDSIKNILRRINAEEKAKKLDSLFSHYNQIGGYNGNVLISQSGQIIFKKSYGYANFKTKEELSLNHAFQLASVSKQFTAVAILKLFEEKKLDLEDSVQKFIPNFPYGGITIKLLLCHRSGLPNYIYFLDNNLKYKEIGISNDSIIKLLICEKPNKYYQPDRKFDYSNTGYIVLAYIVEKVSGLSFEKYLDENIFNPLGMKNTFVYNNLNDNYKSYVRATGYQFPEREIQDNYLNASYGDKGVYSTVEDLYLWEQALYTDKIIKRQSLEIAFQPHNKEMKYPKNYGFGWRTYQLIDSTKMIYHRGWWHGFQNLLSRIETDTTSIILLRNRKTKYIIDYYEILEILYPEKKYDEIKKIKSSLPNKNFKIEE